MFSAFRVLSGCNTDIARAIFYTLDSFPGKKTLLRRVARITANEAEKALVEDIISASEQSNNQRREIAHSLMWLTERKADASFHAFTPKGGHRLATKEWHQNLMQHSREALKAGRQAFEQLCQKRGVPPQVCF